MLNPSFAELNPYPQKQEKFVQKDFLNAEVIGRRQQEEFVNNQIKTKKVLFYYLIKKTS